MNMLSLVTGFLQLTVVLVFVLLLVRWVRHRSPALAASLGTLGLMLGCLVVALVAFDVPRIIRTSIPAPVQAAASPVDTVKESAMAVSATTPTLSLHPVLSWLADQKVLLSPAQQGRAGWGRLSNSACAMLLFLPLLVGLLATVHLHHRSCLLPRSAQQQLLQYAPAENVSFRVSKLIMVPCVTFYGGRTIYLPRNWEHWTRDEISAAIAHETAHLDRRDAFQRLAVQTACLIQWFHPMAWLLGRSICLSQEMAADRQAAASTFGNYAVGLSKIALRTDAQSHSNATHSIRTWFTRPGIVSVSSSHLIRRIKMLSQQTEGSVSVYRARWCQLAVIATFVVSAGWNLRADQPPESSGNGPVARIASVPKGGATQDLFTLPRLSPWKQIPGNDQGFAVLRIRRVLQHPTFAFAAPMLDPMIDQAWRSVASDHAADDRIALGLGLSNLDTVVVGLQTTIENRDPKLGDGTGHNSDFTVGSDGLVMRFIDPIVHDDLRSALDVDRVAEILEQIDLRSEELGGMTMAQVIQEVLDGILTSGATTKKLSVMPSQKEETEHGQVKHLRQVWTQVDGGMVTLCSALPDTVGYVGNEMDRRADHLLSQAAAVGVGVDIGKTTGASWLETPLHIRMALSPRDGVTAGQLVETLRQAMSAWRDAAQQIEGEDENLKTILQTLDTCSVFRSPSGENAMVTLKVSVESFSKLGFF